MFIFQEKAEIKILCNISPSKSLILSNRVSCCQGQGPIELRVSRTQISGKSKGQLSKITLKSYSSLLNYQALVDSGADTKLMDFKITDDLHLSHEGLPQHLTASALDGRLMCIQTAPVTLIFDDSPQKDLKFLLYKSVHHPLILVYPWLIKHNPHINQATGNWVGENCVKHCFSESLPAHQEPHEKSIIPTSPEFLTVFGT